MVVAVRERTGEMATAKTGSRFVNFIFCIVKYLLVS